MNRLDLDIAETEAAIREARQDVGEAGSHGISGGLRAIEIRPIPNQGDNSASTLVSRASADYYFAAAFEKRTAGSFAEAKSVLGSSIALFPVRNFVAYLDTDIV
jgi:hypothetical protein